MKNNHAGGHIKMYVAMSSDIKNSRLEPVLATYRYSKEPNNRDGVFPGGLRPPVNAPSRLLGSLE